MGIRGEVFSTKAALPNRTYFFNVKENRMGDLYLNIVESKNKETGGFDRQSLVLFADDLQVFLSAFDESLKVLEKSVREKRKPGRAGKPDRPGRPDNQERPDRSNRSGRPEKKTYSGKPGSAGRVNGVSRTGRSGGAGRSGGTGKSGYKPDYANKDRPAGKRLIVRKKNKSDS